MNQKKLPSLLKAVMATYTCEEEEARQIIDDMVHDMEHGISAEEVIEEWGLEPDYVFDLIAEYYGY